LAVHRAISTQVSAWAAGGKVSAHSAQQEAKDWLGATWNNADRTLIEFRNGVEFDERTLLRLKASSVRMLQDFFRLVWPRFGSHVYETHEKLDSFLLGRVRVWVRVDLATRDSSGRLVVTDWKTNLPGTEEDARFQILVYALWASQRFGCEPTDVVLQVVNLRTGSIAKFDPTDVVLEDVLRRIKTEAKHLRGMSHRERFPPHPSVENCTACRHLTQCNEGEAAIQAANLVDLREL
jgi:hypothetical protein